MRTFKSYLFRDKDPAIQEFRTVVQDHFGKLSRKGLKQIDESGGPRTGTMVQWFYGKTKRPQNATLEAAGRAIGYRRKWVKWNGGPE